MLVLTRRERQSFTLMDQDGEFLAEMKVLEATPTGKLIFGFRAARNVKILRSEMLHGGAQGEGQAVSPQSRK